MTTLALAARRRQSAPRSLVARIKCDTISSKQLSHNAGAVRTTHLLDGATSERVSGSHRQKRSLVRCVPPHQRSIGLWRLKFSSPASTALPSSVSDNRDPLYRSNRPESLSMSRENGPSSSPATDGLSHRASPSSRAPTS